MVKQIVVRISPDGDISVDAQGFQGAECEKATKKLVDALGGGESTRKPEFYQEQKAEQEQSW